MTIEKFQSMIAGGEPLEGEEMIQFMRGQSDISRRIQFDLNCNYHTPEEIRELFVLSRWEKTRKKPQNYLIVCGLSLVVRCWSDLVAERQGAEPLCLYGLISNR